MAISALLVANSHLEEFYPKAWLAGDGLLGNSLFFFLAGFGLVRSELNQRRSFTSWYWRRLVRIYPSLLLVMAVFGVAIDERWREWHGVTDAISQNIWPTGYTFIAMIFPFYLLFFPLLRSRNPKTFAIAILLLCVTYAVGYVPDIATIHKSEPLHLSARPYLVHVSAYFQVMLLGGLAGFPRKPRAEHIGWRLAATALVFAVYVSAKYLMVTGHFARAYPLLHLLVAALCILMFDSLSASSVLSRVKRIPFLWRCMTVIAAMTLEIYLVHLFVAGYHWVWGAMFPLNLVLFWGLSLPLARVVNMASESVQRRLRRDDRALATPGAHVRQTVA